MVQRGPFYINSQIDRLFVFIVLRLFILVGYLELADVFFCFQDKVPTLILRLYPLR